jgi:hypothetical protein
MEYVICWTLFCVIDDKEVDHGNPHVMTCLLCYNNYVMLLIQAQKKENDL